MKEFQIGKKKDKLYNKYGSLCSNMYYVRQQASNVVY